MLRQIPKIVSPDLMKYLMEMGHSDILVIADANFPAHTHGKRVLRMEGVSVPELLVGILQFFPLDDFISHPVGLMRNRPEEETPKIWKTYEGIIHTYDKEQAFKEFSFLDRLDFYKESKDAYLIIQTGDTTRYANITLQKGVC